MANVEIVRYGTFYEGLSQTSMKDFMELSEDSQYSQGQTLYREDDLGSFVLLILSGSVALTSHASNSTETLLDIRSAGDLVGEREVLEGIRQRVPGVPGTPPLRTSQARTLSPVSARRIRRKDFAFLVRDHSDIWQLIAYDLQLRLMDAEKRLSQAVAENANQRLARALLELPMRRGQRINNQKQEIPLSQDELASWIGSSRGTVERILQGWRKRGIVFTGYRSVTVADAEKLVAISGLRGTRRPAVRTHRGAVPASSLRTAAASA